MEKPWKIGHLSAVEKSFLQLEAEQAVKEYQMAAQERINRLVTTLQSASTTNHSSLVNETTIKGLMENSTGHNTSTTNSHAKLMYRTFLPETPFSFPRNQATEAVPSLLSLSPSSGVRVEGGRSAMVGRAVRGTAAEAQQTSLGLGWLAGVGGNTMDWKERSTLESLDFPQVPEASGQEAVLDPKQKPAVKRKQKRCAFEGCVKGAAPPTLFCISHGGGRRCEYEGCDKAKRAPSSFCRRHGGGKRCQKAGCEKAAISAYQFCAKHGGGKRCCAPDCGKYAEPPTDRCKGHGGGARCEVEGCPRSARRPTRLCSAHGGGKRCVFEGCSKAAVKNSLCWAHRVKDANGTA